MGARPSDDVLAPPLGPRPRPPHLAVNLTLRNLIHTKPSKTTLPMTMLLTMS